MPMQSEPQSEPQSEHETILAWARENVPVVEITCDMLCDDPGEVELPTLAAHERELESLLLACLQVRSGGLDPKTPSRDRVWLWRGLLGRQGEVIPASDSRDG